MNDQMMCRIVTGLLATTLFMTCGCGSTAPSRFYLLQSHPSIGNALQAADPGPGAVIGVGPVEMPDYLNRPQMVTRINRQELKLSEFNRWAETLEKNFTRVLAGNLSELLSTDNVLVYPWAGTVKVERQVEVHVIQFDGRPGGDVLLKAHWSLTGDDGKDLLLMKKSQFSAPAGQGYSEMVEAMNRVLAELSREIATAIKER
jgi:uncharacterized lipoprotein YmbA